MRDETIRVGDLVHAVWGCCADMRGPMGTVFEVVAVQAEFCTICAHCKHHNHRVPHLVVRSDTEMMPCPAPRTWFKKIHPPELLGGLAEGAKTDIMRRVRGPA